MNLYAGLDSSESLSWAHPLYATGCGMIQDGLIHLSEAVNTCWGWLRLLAELLCSPPYDLSSRIARVSYMVVKAFQGAGSKA